MPGYPTGDTVARTTTAHPALRYVWDPSALGRGAGGDLDAVEHEDDAVVEAVQAGGRSRGYGGGRYAPGWEAGVHAFHRRVAQAAGGGNG